MSSTGSTASFKENAELLSGKTLSSLKDRSGPRDDASKGGDDDDDTSLSMMGTSATAVVPVKQERVTLYVWFLTAMISISGLLFGLDTGIISESMLSSSWSSSSLVDCNNARVAFLSALSGLSQLNQPDLPYHTLPNLPSPISTSQAECSFPSERISVIP